MAFIGPDNQPAAVAGLIPARPEALALLAETSAPMTVLHSHYDDPSVTLLLPQTSAYVLDLLRSYRWTPQLLAVDEVQMPPTDADMVTVHVHVTAGLLSALAQVLPPYIFERQRDCWIEWGEQMKNPGREHGMLHVRECDAETISEVLTGHDFWHEVTEHGRWDEVIPVPGAPDDLPMHANDH